MPSRSEDSGAAAFAVGGGAVVAGNEARGALANHRVGQAGRSISTAGTKVPRHFHRVKGVSDHGGPITQASHPEGTYHVSTAALRHVRTHPTPNAAYAKTKASIADKGFTSPVHMKVYRDGAELWDGNHRAAIADELGHKHIPVTVTHVAGPKPKPSTLWGARNEARHARYRAHLLGEAAHLAKGATMTTSAFGIVHTSEIEKGLFGAVSEAVPHLRQAAAAMRTGGGFGQHLDNAFAAFKGGLHAPSGAAAAAPKRPMPGKRPSPGPTAVPAPPRPGAMQRVRAGVSAHPVGAAAGAAGVGGAGAYGLSRRKQGY